MSLKPVSPNTDTYFERHSARIGTLHQPNYQTFKFSLLIRDNVEHKFVMDLHDHT